MKAMEEAGLVPSLISKAPQRILSITFNNGKEVTMGNELTPTEVKLQPTVKWDFEDNVHYTLVMVDPDAPSRRFNFVGEVIHWLVSIHYLLFYYFMASSRASLVHSNFICRWVTYRVVTWNMVM